MKENMNFKKMFLIFGLVLLSAGCRIEYNAESDVHEDGSISRTTVFHAQENADKDEILKRYDLPQGGEWANTPVNIFKFLIKEPVSQAVATYQVKQTFPAGKTGTDFKRFTMARDRAAQNQFKVTAKSIWFVKWFKYEEEFADAIDSAKVKLVIDKIMDKGLATFKTELSSRIPDAKLVDRVMVETKVKYGALLGRYYTLVDEKGWDFKGVEVLSREVEKEFSSEAASKFLTAKFRELDNETGRKAIADSFHATQAAMDEYMANDKEMQTYGQDIFGAHGFPLFQAYEFKVSVKLPGTVTSTNADEKENGALVWKFTSEKLNRELLAKSRLFYPFRILAAFVVLLTLVFAGAAFGIKKK